MNKKSVNKKILATFAGAVILLAGMGIGASTGDEPAPEPDSKVQEVTPKACTSALASSDALQLIYAQTLQTTTSMVDRATLGETANMESDIRTLGENQAKIIKIQENYDKFSKLCRAEAKE